MYNCQSWTCWLWAAFLFTILIAVLWLLKRRFAPLIAPSTEPDLDCFLDDIDGFRICYRASGQGPPLILVHGLGASSYVWRTLVPLLEKDFRVLLIDLPGFGRSSKNREALYGFAEQGQRVIKVLDQLQISEATLVGSSMGGAICLWLALHHPQRFHHVVTLAPAWNPAVARSLRVHLTPLLPYIGPLLNPFLMGLLLRRVVANKAHIRPEVVANYLKPYRDPGAFHAFRGSVYLILDHQLKNKISGIQSAVLLLHGRRDYIVPYKFSVHLHHRLLHSKLALHPLAGHHVMEDDPEWVAQNIRTFLRKTPSSS